MAADLERGQARLAGWGFLVATHGLSPGQKAFAFRAAHHDATPSGQDSYLNLDKHIQSIPPQNQGFSRILGWCRVVVLPRG
jgi:hypothetical protein